MQGLAFFPAIRTKPHNRLLSLFPSAWPTARGMKQKKDMEFRNSSIICFGRLAAAAELSEHYRTVVKQQKQPAKTP